MLNFHIQENSLLQFLLKNPVISLLPQREQILLACMIPQGSWHLLSALLTLLVSGLTFRCLI